MSKPAGKCIFCGQPGLTKGHIWPEWFGTVLTLNAPHHEQAVGEVHTFVPRMRTPPVHRRIRQGHAGSRKPRNTCAECNGSWMSRIEQAAIPVAAPLMRGDAVLLDTIGQRLLASLLCLITIRVEFTDPATLATPKEERDWLRLRGEPPPNWKIWLARYAGEEPHQHWCRHNGLEIVDSPETPEGGYTPKCNTQTTTLVFGELCAHVYSSSVWTDFRGYEGVRLSRIWPPNQIAISWLHTGWLSDAAVLSLSESLARE